MLAPAPRTKTVDLVINYQLQRDFNGTISDRAGLVLIAQAQWAQDVVEL
jgi:hypothetical protein